MKDPRMHGHAAAIEVTATTHLQGILLGEIGDPRNARTGNERGLLRNAVKGLQIHTVPTLHFLDAPRTRRR